MKNRRYRRPSRYHLNTLAALAFLASCLASGSQAAEIFTDTSIIDQALDIVAAKHDDSRQAQQEIDRLANSASSLYEEFKRENDNLEALLVVNAGFRKQIAAQEEQIAQLDESIAGVVEVTREIPLLMEKMLSSIEQFVELDYPFHIEERRNRIQFARDAIDNPNVSIAEKFRQVLVLYQNETAAGRTNETYPDVIELNGEARDVTMVRIGRVALIYQTIDRRATGAWDNNARAWVELDPIQYRTAAQSAIRVASSLDAPDILELPVLAPEAAQ